MNKFLKIKGGSPEEKFNHLEKILQRISRRLHKTIVTVVPPSPMFSYTEKPSEEGIITRCVFPANGKVTRLCLAISEFTDKERVVFDVELQRVDIYGNTLEKLQRSFNTRKNIEVADVNFDVKVGDCLTLSTISPEKIKGIWVSVLYIIDMPDGVMNSISYDEIDKLIEAGMEDEGILS